MCWFKTWGCVRRFELAIPTIPYTHQGKGLVLWSEIVCRIISLSINKELSCSEMLPPWCVYDVTIGKLNTIWWTCSICFNDRHWHLYSYQSCKFSIVRLMYVFGILLAVCIQHLFSVCTSPTLVMILFLCWTCLLISNYFVNFSTNWSVHKLLSCQWSLATLMLDSVYSFRGFVEMHILKCLHNE